MGVVCSTNIYGKDLVAWYKDLIYTLSDICGADGWMEIVTESERSRGREGQRGG